ncbi:TlpA family protein disulfide reductase [Aquimarina pacifica]|uniref:TlpA family protein disulfide reductase n=1 Tax=Aquimarina pacifica TaxID=1296415 RepID=UPI000470028A|nr:TlpA disulfide reductase family protein [Aquimarina pacifica]
MRFILLFIFGNLFISCAQPPTQFDTTSLEDTFVTLDAVDTPFDEILEKHKGKTIFIDIWASWCKDCIIGMPKVNKLHKKYPDVQFVFLTVDHDVVKWKKGIQKFKIEYGDHYLIKRGWKGSPFCTFIDLDWIPRYMIIDTTGQITLFKATKATDRNIIKSLDSLL